MKKKFISLLREPDFVTGATDASPFNFEENLNYGCPIDYEYKIEKDSAKVIVHPSSSPVKYLKLRFFGDNFFVEKVYGDQWARSCAKGELEWKAMKSDRILPWYCMLYSEGRVACYGVKTGCDSFALWQVDNHGITLFLNLCNANEGTDLKESIIACEIVELFSEGESVYSVAKRFAKKMCDAPVLPKGPVFGMNDWYWAYGDNNRESILRQTDYLRELTVGCKNRPCMVIDDGWQTERIPISGKYNGGPWDGNERYGDMRRLAEDIMKRNATPGIWFRSLLTMDKHPEEAILEMREAGGWIMDPSHPATLEKVEGIASHLTDFGFGIIKHDFSCPDFFGTTPDSVHQSYLLTENRSYFDKTKTNAMLIKELYRAIQRGAGDADIVACDTVPHLTAGIHSMMRVGADTSGRVYEWTKRQGVNSVMRLPINNCFFRADFDCAAFTARVDEDINLDFLEMCAYTGTATIASATPYILSDKGAARMADIYKIADSGKYELGIVNYENAGEPEIFESEDGTVRKEFNWTKPYNGSRVAYGWYE